MKGSWMNAARAIRIASLGIVVLLSAGACATPDSAQPSGDTSTRYHVQSLTKDGEAVDLGDWREIILPDAPVAGLISPVGVCNGPSFMVTDVDAQTWSTEKTGNETEEGCTEEGLAIKGAAIAVLEGRLTVQETEGHLELTNPPYQLVLEPSP